MGKVQMLSEVLINKIAAGEVVERPASAVKELVENAIDAGATRIDIDIEQGGKKLIRIADNGHGMSREDAEMSLQRHATSKLRHENDLFQIMTMGFRGEALPSIASVSLFRLQTRTEDEPEGTQVVVDGGGPPDITATGRAPGTTVEVNDLFCNIPGRKKFLKADGTEFSHIAEAITRLSLANPDVYFKLSHNRRVQLQAPSTDDLRERVGAVLGHQVGRNMYPVSLDTSWLKISGLFSEPNTSTQGTKGIYLFVNGRFIKDRGLSHACQEAYRGTIEKGRYPYVVISIDIDPSEIDVNVHPQKIEVRFQRQHEVYSRLLTTLRSNIAKAPWLVRAQTQHNASPQTNDNPQDDTPANPQANPQANPPTHSPSQQANQPQSNPQSSHTPANPTANPPANRPIHPGANAHPNAPGMPAAAPRNFEEFRSRFIKAAEAQGLPTPASSAPVIIDGPLPPLPNAQSGLPFLPGWDPSPGKQGQDNPDQDRPAPESNAAPAPQGQVASSHQHAPAAPATAQGQAGQATHGFFSSLRYIGQFAQMYLLFEANNHLIMIDQHAAHERISYQRLLQDFEKASIPQQRFLIPPRLELSLTAAQQAEQHQEDLERLGVSIEPFGGQSFAVKALPAIIKDAEPHALLHDLLDELSSGKRTASLDEKRDNVLMRMACHGSVRGSHRLNEDEVRSLQRQLDSIDFRAHCPHGRPVYFELPQKEIEKRFHRT